MEVYGGGWDKRVYFMFFFCFCSICFNDFFDFDIRRVYFSGKFSDSLVGVFICGGVNVVFYFKVYRYMEFVVRVV